MEVLIQFIKDNWYELTRKSSFAPSIREEVIQLTSFLDNSYENIKFTQRLWHVKNNLLTLQYCPYCKVGLLKWNGVLDEEGRHTYSKCCCKTCADERSRQIVSDNYKANPNIVNQRKQTNLKRYGKEHACQNEELKDKIRDSHETRTGFKGPFANPEFNKQIAESNHLNKVAIHKKRKNTWTKKYGTTNTFDLYTHPKTKQYKDTPLFYQSSYEEYFLQQMELIGLLDKIKRGPTFNYIWENQNHKYFSDFIIGDTIIEIKSTWTYNKHGKDKNLQNRNDVKWNSAREKHSNFIVLFSKSEINAFIEGLKLGNYIF